jgi:hypothetical protein
MLFAIVLSLNLEARAAIRIQLIEGRPIVDGVFVNGHGPYRFLLDTAATLNHIEPQLAQSIGLRATWRTELTSSLGSRVVPGTDQAEVVLGDNKASAQKFVFAGMEVVHQLTRGVDGILGQEFLGRFDYLLDLKAKSIDFGDRSEPDPSISGQRAPFRAHSGRAAIETSLGDLVLDSGASSVVLFGIRPDNSSSGFMSTLAGSQFVGMVYRRLVISGRRIWSGDAVAIPDRNEPGVSGLMPLRLFRSVYMSNSGHYAILE